MRFYLGTHQPAWLGRRLGVPLLVSHRRLGCRRSLPRATEPWALDSGGFTELTLYGRWVTSSRGYVAAVRRYADEIGHLDWAAPQDWMTEDHILTRTGATLREHQNRTLDNYLHLRDLAPELPFIPVLHGRTEDDYLRCVDLYEHAGVDLAGQHLVGVGSVCRRQHTTEIERIIRVLAAHGLTLHGFGVKTTGLTRYASALSSADSMAWSFCGRYVPGCSSTHRTEANCVHFALAWHRRLLGSLESPRPQLRAA